MTSAQTSASVATVPASPVSVATVVPAIAPGIRDKTLSARQIDETKFWSTQFKEHCLFLYIGLEANPVVIESALLAPVSAIPSVKTQAPVALQTQSVENAKLILKLKQRSKQLIVSWSAFEKMIAQGKIDVPILNNLINHTRYIKTRVLDLQKQKIWTGWLFPDFLDHLIAELDYFVARFNDTIPADMERLFWDEINAEHLAFTAHLLDTDYKTRSVVSKALSLSDEGWTMLAPIKDVPIDLLQMAQLSRRFDHLGYANRTNDFYAELWNNGNPATGSNIHPVLVAHVIREGQRSIQRLTELGSPPPVAAGKAYQQLAAKIRAG